MSKYNAFRGKRKYYGKKKPVSATRKAYLAGVKAGKRMARSKRRWY